MEKGSIAIIGRVAEGVDLYDGQTVTTRILRDELRKSFDDTKIICVDTYQYKRHLMRCFLNTLNALLQCEHLIILLSRNGCRFYFPFLYYANKLLHRKIYHRVIGGNLGGGVEQYPVWVKYLNSFSVNWVEGTAQLNQLVNLGITNAVETYTFRNSQIITQSEFPDYTGAPYRFCTFCRVTKSKGISEAIHAVMRINQMRGDIAKLDIYGPLEEPYRQEFEELLALAGDSVRYMGSVPPEKSVDTLKDYFVHLFPTTWKGEGMPGTLVDAFASGLPTIATDWNQNADVLTEGVTGFCYDWRKPELLAEKMLYAIDHPGQIAEMRFSCIKEAEQYTPDVVMEQIIREIEK